MLTNLEQLYISNNGIDVLENLDQNVNLTTIDFAANKITKLDNLQNLDKITEFWFNDNQVYIGIAKFCLPEPKFYFPCVQCDQILE